MAKVDSNNLRKANGRVWYTVPANQLLLLFFGLLPSPGTAGQIDFKYIRTLNY